MLLRIRRGTSEPTDDPPLKLDGLQIDAGLTCMSLRWSSPG